jgi:curved DNA-binding protein
MAIKFKDYYEVLKVARTATQDQIQRAYRKLARKYHPDVSKEAGAEDKFKELGEAYEVLRDAEKRKKYDELGADWKTGQDFRPPPGWEPHSQYGSGAGPEQTEFQWGGGGSFSDFFEMLFGGRGFQDTHHRGGGRAGTEAVWRQRGRDQEATLKISLEDAYRGTTKGFTLQMQAVTPEGQVRTSEKSYEVKIPPGVLPGQKIRLSGQGGEGFGGGEKGDLYLRIEIEAHPRYRLEGRDLYFDLPVSPWEAALGAEISLTTLSGAVNLKVPAGSHSGQKLRLRGKGMPQAHGTAGDLFVVISIQVPKNLSDEEQHLYEELKRISTFDPRKAA